MFRGGEENREEIIGECVAAFPFMWLFVSPAACESSLLLTLSPCQFVSATTCL